MRRKPTTPDFSNDIFEGLDDNFDDTIKPLSMAQLKKMTLLDKLESLISVSENCALKADFFQLHKDLIQSVADDLVLTPKQAVLLCPFCPTPVRLSTTVTCVTSSIVAQLPLCVKRMT